VAIIVACVLELKVAKSRAVFSCPSSVQTVVPACEIIALTLALSRRERGQLLVRQQLIDRRPTDTMREIAGTHCASPVPSNCMTIWLPS